LGSFYQGNPTVFLVSNFQSLFSETAHTPRSSFEVSSRTLRTKESPLIIVTGDTNAVTRHQRARLKHAAEEYPNDGGRMRRLLGRINVESAQSKSARELISRECSVMSLHSDGTMRMQTNSQGAPPAPQLMSGIDMFKAARDAMKPLGIDLSKLQIVQSTGVRFRQGDSGLEEDTCRLSFVELDDSSYEIQRID
jgi:hypothetical protein